MCRNRTCPVRYKVRGCPCASTECRFAHRYSWWHGRAVCTGHVRVLSCILACTSACLPPLQHVLRSIQPDAKLSSLRAMADTASRTAEGLAARQAECLHSVCHELFCSPEITRQGDLQLWEPAYERWRKCHFVLTRAGGWGPTGTAAFAALPFPSVHNPRCTPRALVAVLMTPLSNPVALDPLINLALCSTLHPRLPALVPPRRGRAAAGLPGAGPLRLRGGQGAALPHHGGTRQGLGLAQQRAGQEAHVPGGRGCGRVC